MLRQTRCPPGVRENNIQAGIFLGSGNTQRRQRERDSCPGMHHGWNAQIMGSLEDQIAIFTQRIDPMSNRVQLQADKLEFLDAPLDLSPITLRADVGAETGQTKEAPRMLCTQCGNFIVPFPGILGPRIGWTIVASMSFSSIRSNISSSVANKPNAQHSPR